MATKIKQIMFAFFILAALIFAYIIFKLSSNSNKDWVKNKQTNSTVIEIYNGYKGKPNYKVMLLADSQRFTVPKQMLQLLQIGDSVSKEKDSSFYIFTLQKTKQKIKASWQ